MAEFNENEFDELEDIGDNESNELNESEENESTDSLIPPLGSKQEAADIPQFDLAEDIMAAQRRQTSMSRNAPGPKRCEQDNKTDKEFRTVLQPCEYDFVIAEIVAQDIERIIHS